MVKSPATLFSITGTKKTNGNSTITGKHIARMAGRHTQAVCLHDRAVIGGLVVTILVYILRFNAC